MEALRSSSSKLFADRNRYRAFSSTRALFNRPEIRFFWSQKLNNVDLSQSIFLQFKAIESITSSCFSSESQADVESAETLTQETFQSKTVHVKFQLQKECLFGQQFLLVGDDPMFGLWNPENAIPLNWSEEHIWIVELDIPIGKSIRFKFILKETTGEVVWQPGPDRILQIWDTKNKIFVSEDWENAEVQNITEEEPMVSSVITDEKPNMELIVSDNITLAVEEPMGNTNKEMIVIEELMGNTNKEMIVMDNITYPGEEPKANVNKDSIITEKGIYPKEEMIVAENILGDDGVAVSEEKLICMTDTDSFVNQEGEPVLMPGLSPFPSPTTGEAVPNDGENGNVVDSSDGAVEAEEHNSPEKNKQEQGRNLDQEETIVTTIHDEPTKEEPKGKPPFTREQAQTDYKTVDDDDGGDDDGGDDDVLQKDIQWGRKTLLKVLTNLGFL